MATKKKKTTEKKPKKFPPLVRLTADELQLLRESPYEQPSNIVDREEKIIAKRLVERGLLERDPASSFTVRCTRAGIDAQKDLSVNRVKFILGEIKRLTKTDLMSDLARRMEHDLWMRVIAEAALDGSAIADLAIQSADIRRG